MIYYRNCKQFDETRFRNDISCELNSNKNKNDANYEKIKSNIDTIRTTCVHEKKVLRANNAPFTNKQFSKATRSGYNNRYNKNPTSENKVKYNKQRNICVNLHKKAKREYYNNIDIKLLNDNRKFWKSIKPLFTNRQIRLSKAI